MYDNLVIRAECANVTDTLSCLRSKTAQELQAVNINTAFPGAAAPPLYMYGPTVDGDVIQDYTYKLFAEGKFIKVPTIFGDDSNGGTIFVPQNTSTLADSSMFAPQDFRHRAHLPRYLHP